MKIISCFKGEFIWWFRIFGYGLAGTSVNSDWVPFSIRNGTRKTCKLFGYHIELLKPDENQSRNIEPICQRRMGGKK